MKYLKSGSATLHLRPDHKKAQKPKSIFARELSAVGVVKEPVRIRRFCGAKKNQSIELLQLLFSRFPLFEQFF